MTVTNTALLITGVSLLSLATTLDAPAQTGATPVDAASSNVERQAMGTPGATADQFQDVVVTAQRRDESLSRTPVAVDVVTKEELLDAQITSELDLRQATPGLQVRATLNSNQLNFALRGQSQDGLSGTRPGVLPYVNDVQISGSGGATAFYDLGSVQVLKGPQGTLFGRSATGGAVLYSTAKPTAELDGYISILGGNFDAVKAEGAIGGPIIGDAVQARIAGVYTVRDGFQENVVFGGREGDYRRYGLRGSLAIAPGSTFRNDTVLDYFRSDSESTVGVISGLLPLGAPGEPPFIPAQLIYGGITDPAARSTSIAVIQGALAAQGAALPTDVVAAAYDRYFADPTHFAGGITGYLNQQRARGPFKVGTDAANIYQTENWIVTNTTEFDLAAGLMLKNIFGYVDIDTVTFFDIDGTPFNAASQGLRSEVGRDGYGIATRQISDEFQVLGGQKGDALTYVAGLFFSKEKARNLYDSDFFDLLVAPLGLPAQRVINQFIIRNETWAPYAQGTLALNDSGLSVSAGVRYTDETVSKQKLSRDVGYVAGGDNFAQRDFRKVSWSFGVQDQLNPSLLLYGVTRRAYKSGGYNGSVGLSGPASIGGDEYGAEQITDVEAGAKFNGSLGGIRTRATIALFHNWLEDSQRTAFTVVAGAPAAITVNVPRGKVYGLEADLSLSPVTWLTLGGNLNLLKAKFTDGNVTAAGIDLVYDRLPDTPSYAFGAFADATIPLGSDTEWTLHADVYGQDRSFTSPRSANAAGTTIPSYAVLNLRTGLRVAPHLSLTANVKNVLDKTYYVGGGAAGEIYQVNTLIVAEPRTFTLELRYQF